MIYATAGMLLIAAFTCGSYLLGRLVLALLSPGAGAATALAAPLGTTILALELWLYGALGLPWHPLSMLLPPLVLVAAYRRRLRLAVRADIAGGRAWWRSGNADPIARDLFVGIAGILALLYLYGLVVQPLVGNDAIAIWMFKAKLYFFQGRVDLAQVASESAVTSTTLPSSR